MRANTYVRKIEILQFCLLASEVVWRGRTPYYAINSNRFGKDWSIDIDYSIKDLPKDVRTRTETGPSRKIFRLYLQELLNEKLLTRIKTNDNRAKYYSITPLGICHLIKSEQFFDGIKYPWPERYYTFLTLETFAVPNVKPFNSIIFEGQKFNFTYLFDNLVKIKSFSIREEMTHVFQNFETRYNKVIFYLTYGYDDNNKIRLASFSINDESITVNELGKSSGPVYGDPLYKPLELNEEQFHNYLANLLICAFLYDHTVAKFDIYQNWINRDIEIAKKIRKKPRLQSRIKNIEEAFDEIPEEYLKVLYLFNHHVADIINRHQKLMNGFSEKLNQVQFMK
ncbi:MAG: hypothetical protein FJ356_04515 [Thaumarchaeota archaeon]|nr:hypothetical protein [Nitrososphaerota archaeon]